MTIKQAYAFVKRLKGMTVPKAREAIIRFAQKRPRRVQEAACVCYLMVRFDMEKVFNEMSEEQKAKFKPMKLAILNLASTKKFWDVRNLWREYYEEAQALESGTMTTEKKFASAIKKAIKGAEVILPDDGEEGVYVEYPAELYFKNRGTKRHADARIRVIARKTGLLRKYEQSGSGMMIGGPRDISFHLKNR